MTSTLDGKSLAMRIKAEISSETTALASAGLTVTLAVVVATMNSSSLWYVRALVRSARAVGIAVRVVDLGEAASERAILDQIRTLAADSSVHAIIIQTPLPAVVSFQKVVEEIPPSKDVDGANPLSAGRIFCGLPAFAPATASAVIELLAEHHVAVAGSHCVVVGRSLVVGKPLASLLLQMDATVTVCHSRTERLAAIARQADVLIAAIGRPGFIGPDHVKPGATVIDVGTTPNASGELQGDVSATAVYDVAGGLSPVPGGVGPVTTAVLLKNTLSAARRIFAEGIHQS